VLNYKPEILSIKDYYAYGSEINERTFEPIKPKYRYGFNTQEKIFEINKDHYTARYWEYDSRLGRRWNVDPKPNPSISDYATFSNYPIWFKDPLGDIFKIGTDDQQAKKDIIGLVRKKNQKYLKFQEDGEVKLDFSGLSEKKINKLLKNDGGLLLIHRLITAKDEEGNDIYFFYGTKGPVGARDRQTKQVVDIPFPPHPPGYETKEHDFFLNLSVTPYSKDDPYYLPKEGYHGQVLVAPGYAEVSELQDVYDNLGNVIRRKVVIKKVRSEIIFHELRENYFRTVHKLPYEEAHKRAGGIGEIHKFIFE